MSRIEKAIYIFYITFFANIIVAFIMSEDFTLSILRSVIVGSFGSAITGVLSFMFKEKGDVENDNENVAKVNDNTCNKNNM